MNSKQCQLYTQNEQHEVLIPELPSKLKSISKDSRNQQICVLPISCTMVIFLILGFSNKKGLTVFFFLLSLGQISQDWGKGQKKSTKKVDRGDDYVTECIE